MDAAVAQRGEWIVSSPRTLPSNVLAEIPADAVAFFFFVRIDWAAGTVRYTDYPGGTTQNIDGSSHFWDSSFGMEVGAISQGENAAAVVNQVTFSNADASFTSRAAAGILAGTPITIWVGWFDSSGTFLSAFELMAGEYDSAQLDAKAQISIVPPQSAWGQDLPRPRYTSSCPYIFKDQETCQYAGTDTSCTKALSDCTTKGNQLHFGGDPLMPVPGTVVSYGDANRPMPGRDQLVNK